MDGLQLLAEEHLPLPLAQLLLHLAANLLLCLEDADLPLEVHEELSKPVLHRESLEKLLLLLGLELGVERDEVRQLARLGDPAEQVIHDLLRDSAKTAQLGRSLANLLVERGERRLIGIERRHVVHAPADDLHVPVLDRVLERRTSDLALDHHLNAAGHPLHLSDPRDRADAVQGVGVRDLDVGILLGDREDALVSGDGRLDRLQRHLSTGRDRRRHCRERHRPAEGQHREAGSLREGGSILLFLPVGAVLGRAVGVGRVALLGLAGSRVLLDHSSISTPAGGGCRW